MRILYHHRTQAEDAQGIHIHEIIRSFRALGHDVKEVALVDSEKKQIKGTGGESWSKLTPRLPNIAYELLEIGYNPIGYAMLERAAHRFSPDFVYERYALHTFAGSLLARRKGVPIVIEVNAPLALEQAETKKLTWNAPAKASERFILKNATHVIAVSTPLKEILVAAGVPASKIVVMPNGVDPDQFHGRPTGDAVRARHGLLNARVLGFVGWIREWHGLVEVVRAMPMWGEALSDVHLLVVGDGPAKANLLGAAQAANVAHRVHITGAVARAEVVDHLAAIDVALQPAATRYASPMKIFEYLAMKKPVLAPRQPNLVELLDEGKNALFFEPNDFGDLAQKARDIFSNPSRLDFMREQARATIFERDFLWTKNAERVVELVTQAG